MNTNSHTHSHSHNQQKGDPASSQDILQFFSCCLGEDPAPISKKIQNLRANLPESTIEEVNYHPGTAFHVSPDMVVADLLTTFSQTRPYLENLNPLGLLSPTLHTTSLEMFLIDFNVDLETVCRDLDSLINQS